MQMTGHGPEQGIAHAACLCFCSHSDFHPRQTRAMTFLRSVRRSHCGCAERRTCSCARCQPQDLCGCLAAQSWSRDFSCPFPHPFALPYLMRDEVPSDPQSNQSRQPDILFSSVDLTEDVLGT